MPPQTRARFAHSTQEEVLRLPPYECDAIRSRTGPVWERIAETPPVGWLDEATYNTLTESIRAVLGDAAMTRLYRRLGRRLISNPSFQSFLESVIRVFGLSPHTLLKAAPRGRDSVVKDSGTLEYEFVSPSCARLHLRGFPPSTFASGTTVILLSGTWLGLLDVAGVGSSAALTTEAVNLRAGNVTFVLKW